MAGKRVVVVVDAAKSSLVTPWEFLCALIAWSDVGHCAVAVLTRHRASTIMYSLTFCVRVMLPERQQWKPAVQAAAVMLRTPPVDGQSPASQPRPLPIYGTQFWERPSSLASHRPAARADPAQPAARTMSSYRGMDASLQLGFALCCHCKATRASIANPPNSAQLEGSLYHAAKLHPGPCSSVGVRPRTDRQTHTDTHTDTQTRVTTIHFASSTTHAECNDGN